MEGKEQFKNTVQASVRLESIISAAMDAIISVNSDQIIILFNPAAERMFRLPASEAVGSHINRFIPERFRSMHGAQMRSFGETGATHRRMGRLGSVRGLRADGTEFPAEASISHVDVDGRRIYTVIMRDISERVAAEDMVRQVTDNLERLVHERTRRLRDTVSELEQISYSITHDMRAPLRAIQSFAGIIEEEATSLSPEHRGYLSTMAAAARRMDALIRDVLTYSTVVRQEVTMTVIDAEALLKAVLDTYPQFQEPAAKITMQPGIPKVRGSEALLTQCFSNLLSNGIKFSKPGSVPEVRVSGCIRDGWARIAFADYGVGIPQELHGKIFGIFEKLNNQPGGTGIGLAIVRKAAERMSGRVSVESKPGQGSTFFLDLPPA